jgi:DNA repair exonuclease SbcCD ATPase subunit
MIQNYRNLLEQKKGKKNQIENQIQTNKINIKQFKLDYEQSLEAQKILQIVAKQTQDQIIFHISDIITLALNSIFDEPYQFKLDFVEKRGKTEAEIYFLKDDKKIDPMTESGGGVVDVASIALRIALWSLSNRSNTIILDEPGKFISKNYINRVSEMLKMLSEKLKIQLIVVTHIPELKEKADKIFNISIEKGISKINL